MLVPLHIEHFISADYSRPGFLAARICTIQFSVYWTLNSESGCETCLVTCVEDVCLCKEMQKDIWWNVKETYSKEWGWEWTHQEQGRWLEQTVSTVSLCLIILLISHTRWLLMVFHGLLNVSMALVQGPWLVTDSWTKTDDIKKNTPMQYKCISVSIWAYPKFY